MKRLHKLIAQIDIFSPPRVYIRNLLKVICDTQGYKFGTVITIDEQGNGNMLASYNLPDEYPERINRVDVLILSSPSGEAIETCKIVLLNDPLSDPRLAPWREILEPYNIKKMVWVPLLSKDKIFGTYVLYDTNMRDISTQEKQMLEQIGVMVSIAISSNQYLYQLNVKTKELEIANKTKSEFLATMSHELRTPLNSIIGFSEILHDEIFGPLNEKQLRYSNNILTSGKHLLNLINDILDLSKIEAGKMELIYEDFLILSAINEVKILFTSIISKNNITINIVVDEKVSTIQADIRKFKQILSNLISNAIKFSPKGGTVTIEAKRVDNHVRISVTDTGIGISDEDQKKLFKSFVQIDSSNSRQFAGTGLGLALVKQFVEMHGGKVWVESEPDKGSTFIVTLPIMMITSF
jgi:signal transduction histidine kinase